MTHNHHKHQRRRLQRAPQLVRGLLPSFVVMLLCSTGIYAIPLTEYHRNLQEAVTALDTFGQADEEEVLSEYQQRVTQTVAALRTSLPKTQAVESGGEICNIDNTWLHHQLDLFEKAADSERSAIVAHIIERLHAMERIASGKTRGQRSRQSRREQKARGDTEPLGIRSEG